VTFDDAMLRVAEKTILSPERLRGLWDAVKDANQAKVPGDLVECGCWRGGSAAILGRADDTRRRLWVLDSFAGMPAPSEKDPPQAAAEIGLCVATEDDVVKFLVDEGLSSRVITVPGLFKDTIPILPVQKIAVLHIDCDWYESVKQCLEGLYDKVSATGTIQFDDYGHWPGARVAVDDFFRGRGIQPGLSILDYTGRQHRKP